MSDIYCCNFGIISLIVERNILDSKLYTNP